MLFCRGDWRDQGIHLVSILRCLFRVCRTFIGYGSSGTFCLHHDFVCCILLYCIDTSSPQFPEDDLEGTVSFHNLKALGHLDSCQVCDASPLSFRWDGVIVGDLQADSGGA
jgi:hypothetical protein